MKNRIMAAALAACALFTASGCAQQTSSQSKIEYITEITVEEPQEAVSYSADAKTYAAESLKSTLSAVLVSAYGEGAATISDTFSDSIAELVDSCEARAVSESDLYSIVDELCSEQELFAALLTGTESDSYPALQLFSTIASITGTDTACLIIYDGAIAYCNYYIRIYRGLYDTYGYAYQLATAEEWESKRAGIESVGEENFGYLLKTSISAISVQTQGADSVQSLISGVSAGEGATYLRAQGYMMQKLTLTSDDWNFVFEFLADDGNVAKLAAICAAGDAAAIAPQFPQFISDIADALTQADNDCAQAALDGDYSAFLKRLLSSWTEDEWNNLTALLEGLTGDYEEYFTSKGLMESYSQFVEGVEEVTLDDLKNSMEETFYTNLVNFVAAYSAPFAYVIFEL